MADNEDVWRKTGEEDKWTVIGRIEPPNLSDMPEITRRAGGVDPAAFGLPSSTGTRPVTPAQMVAEDARLIPPTLDRAFNAYMFGMGDRIGAAGEAMRSYDRGQGFNYSEQLAKARARADAFTREHPVAAHSGELLGALGSGMTIGGPLGMTLLKGESTLGPTILKGALEGGLYGAAQGAGNVYTGKLPDYLVGAGYGAGLGGILGGAFSGGGYALRQAGRAKELPRALEDAATADREGIGRLPSYGPEAMLPDAGPAMRGVAQGAAVGTGVEAAGLRGTLAERDRGTAARVGAALDDTLGPAIVPSQVQRDIRADQTALGPAYDEAFKKAKAVNSAPIAEHIDVLLHERQGNPAILREVRSLLDVPNNPGVLDPYPRTLQAVREHIDGLFQGQLDNGTRAALTQLRNRITEELHAKVPGIADLDRQFAELAKQSKSLERGREVFDTGKEATPPADLAREMAGPSSSQQQNTRLSQGARAELERLVGTNVNDLLKLERVLGEPQDWNAQKLTMIFGPDRADRIMQVLTANRAFRQTYQDVVQGSQTAQRQSAERALEAPQVGAPSASPTLYGDIKKVLVDASQARADRLAAENRDRIAGLLTTRGPEMMDLANRLLEQPTRRRGREEIIDALARAGIRTGGYPATYINR